MLSDDLKRRVVLAQEKGENPDDFLMNNPVESEDLREYETFWHEVARVTHVKPTPTAPSEEASLSNTVGFADGVRYTSAP